MTGKRAQSGNSFLINIGRGIRWQSHRRSPTVAPVTTDSSDWQTVNKALWDERVPIHVDSAFYDISAIKDGFDPLRGFEIDE